MTTHGVVKSGLERIAMDVCSAYITATLEKIPEAENKIAFDKFTWPNIWEGLSTKCGSRSIKL